MVYWNNRDGGLVGGMRGDEEDGGEGEVGDGEKLVGEEFPAGKWGKGGDP